CQSVLFNHLSRNGKFLDLSISWSGRPRKILAKTARRVVRDAKKNPQVMSGEIQAALEKEGVVV
ncbi:hypothetical protein FQN60_004366, partial [Etheostoma spectabile]